MIVTGIPALRLGTFPCAECGAPLPIAIPGVGVPQEHFPLWWAGMAHDMLSTNVRCPRCLFVEQMEQLGGHRHRVEDAGSRGGW